MRTSLETRGKRIWQHVRSASGLRVCGRSRYDSSNCSVGLKFLTKNAEEGSAVAGGDSMQANPRGGGRGSELSGMEEPRNSVLPDEPLTLSLSAAQVNSYGGDHCDNMLEAKKFHTMSCRTPGLLKSSSLQPYCCGSVGGALPHGQRGHGFDSL